VALTRREALLLDLLMSGNSPVPREQILRSFYPNGDSRSGNILDVYVSHLRQKLRMISGGLDLIENIPGAGFRLRGDLLPRSTEDLVEERVVAEQSLVGRTSEMNIAGAGRRLTPLMQMG
jgi:DNA-binding winged helix-turn-helix (wHTH) protein